MRSQTFDYVNIVYQKLVADSFLTAAGITSNQVRKYNRALDSNVEDIVITSLPITNNQLQTGIVNVNVHVPNLQVSGPTGQDNSQPDIVRIKQISDLVILALDNTFGSFYNCTVQQQNLIQDKEDFFNNIRLQINSINNNSN
jgi:hypothetical protein